MAIKRAKNPTAPTNQSCGHCGVWQERKLCPTCQRKESMNSILKGVAKKVNYYTDEAKSLQDGFVARMVSGSGYEALRWRGEDLMKADAFKALASCFNKHYEKNINGIEALRSVVEMLRKSLLEGDNFMWIETDCTSDSFTTVASAHYAKALRNELRTLSFELDWYDKMNEEVPK